jgi:hypothetical protein
MRVEELEAVTPAWRNNGMVLDDQGMLRGLRVENPGKSIKARRADSTVVNSSDRRTDADHRPMPEHGEIGGRHDRSKCVGIVVVAGECHDCCPIKGFSDGDAQSQVSLARSIVSEVAGQDDQVRLRRRPCHCGHHLAQTSIRFVAKQSSPTIAVQMDVAQLHD